MAVEYYGIWSLGYGFDHRAQLFPGLRPDGADGADDETPSVWSLDRSGTVKGWHLRPKDDITETVLVQRRVHFKKHHDVLLDAIAHKIAFVTYSQGGLKVSRDTGSPEAEPQSTSLKRSSRCVSAALTPDAKYVVGGGRDGSVSLWCCDTGDMLRRFSSSTGTPAAHSAMREPCTSSPALSATSTPKGTSHGSSTTATSAPAHDDWVTCIAVAAANDEQRAANPGIEYIVVTVAFDTSLKVWGVGVPPLRDRSTVFPEPEPTNACAVASSSTSESPIANAEVSVALLHQITDPRGRIDSVVLSPDGSMLFVAITGTERQWHEQIILRYGVAANGVLELQASRFARNSSPRYARMTLQLGPMGQNVLVHTIRSTGLPSVKLELLDTETLVPRQCPYADPKKTSNAVLGADRMVHVAPPDGGYIVVSTATFDL